MNSIELGKDLYFHQKIAIAGLHIIMGIAAFPFNPEVAKEHLLLLFPTKFGLREFNSDFFLQSQKIQNGIDEHNDKDEIKIRV